MKNRMPFYKASNFEILKVFLIAFSGATISLIVTSIVFFVAGEKQPSENISLLIIISLAAVGFCCGLGWNDNKYTKLRLIGGILGFTVGLLGIIIFTNFNLLTKILIGLFVGGIGAGVGWFLVWIDPESYSE